MGEMTNKELKELQRLLFLAYARSGEKKFAEAERRVSVEITERTRVRYW